MYFCCCCFGSLGVTALCMGDLNWLNINEIKLLIEVKKIIIKNKNENYRQIVNWP